MCFYGRESWGKPEGIGSAHAVEWGSGHNGDTGSWSMMGAHAITMKEENTVKPRQALREAKGTLRRMGYEHKQLR